MLPAGGLLCHRPSEVFRVLYCISVEKAQVKLGSQTRLLFALLVRDSFAQIFLLVCYFPRIPPVFHVQVGAIIITPTRELAIQIDEVLSHFTRHCPRFR